MVELLDSGFTPTLSHSISYAWSGAQDLKKQGVVFSESCSGTNYPLVYGILNTCRTLYFSIACIATLVMIFAGTLYVQHIASSYLSWQVYATWGLYIASTFINLYIGYYAVVLVGIGDMFHKNRAQMLAKGAFLLLGTLGLICGFGILSLGVAYFASGFVLRFLCKHYLIQAHYFDELLKKYRHQIEYSKRHVLAMMWPNAWRDGLVTVTFYLTGQATVLMSSNFLTLYETGIYSFSMQVINTLLGIANAMFGAYFPAIQSAYVSQNRRLMRQLYSKAMACTLHLSFWGIIAFLLIGIPIIQFIRNDFIIERSSFCVLALTMYLLSRHRNSAAFISTMNKLPYTFSFIFFGVVSISATYIGLAYFHLGLWGLILIPLAVQSIYNNWKWNQVVNRYLHTTEIELMRQGTADLLRIVVNKVFR